MRKKILIVDNERENLKEAVSQLDGDYEVVITPTANEARWLLSEHSKKFDILMTTCFMPGETDGQGPEGEKFIGQEVPVGLVLAILALQKGVSQIIIEGNKGHHDHPIAWLMDSIQGIGGRISSGCEVKWLDEEEEGEPIKDWVKTLEKFPSY